MPVPFKPGALAVLMSITFLVNSAQAVEVTRQIPVDDSFTDFSSEGKGGFAGGIVTRVKVISAGGIIELCGAIVYTNAQTRSAFRNMLKDTYFTINGKRVFKGLHYFHNAKREKKIDSSHANCRSSGVKAVKGLEFDFEASAGTYRVN